MIPTLIAVAWHLTHWRLTGQRARTKAYRQYRSVGWSRVDAVTKARRG